MVLLRVLLGFTLFWISDAIYDLAPRERCVPTATARGPCHACVCDVDGVYYCRAHACQISTDHKPRLRSVHAALPVLAKGQSCSPGKLYRDDCNTCRCGFNNTLMCTKIGCLNKNEWSRVEDTVKKQKKLEIKTRETAKKKKEKTKEKLRLTRGLPGLPQGKCVPGKLYQKDCKACFCTADRKALCVDEAKACDSCFYPESADEVRPYHSVNHFDSLPALPHMAAKCEPGKSYRVNCNACICLINHSLMCDLTMCLSYEDIHISLAGKVSNKNCTPDEKVEDPDECVKCVCTSAGRTKCEAILGCLTSEEQRRNLHGENEKKKPMLALNADHKGKCVAGTIYRVHCNRCFCQDDGSLRCTQKTCLSYAQTLQIQKHRLYLEKHGL